MKIKQYLAIILTVCTISVFAQNEEDILRYSQSNILGTARSQAMGGAFGAVGADFSATQINPAGLSLYRRNEINLSAAIASEKAQTTYIGTSQTDMRTNFNIPSLGIVLTKVFTEMGKDVQDGLSSVSIGAGMNRINTFQQNISFNGVNNNSSILDNFVQRANGTPYTNYNDNYSNDPAAQAWSLYLIDTLTGTTNQYRNPLTGVSPYSLRQGTQINNTGAMYEYNVSAAANISNWLYFGASMVITQVYRESENTYVENVLSPSLQYQSMTFRQNINTRGSGVSGRFGVIVRPIDFLRFGFSAQTATRLNLRDDYQNTMSVNYIPQGVQGSEDYIEYQVITPAKYTASAALILTKYGLLSVDFDITDYANAYMKSDFMNTDAAANTAVTNLYKQAYNVRIGAEAKIADIYRVRAGFAQFGSPYQAGKTGLKESDLTRYSISGGVGIIVDRFFYDFTCVNTFGNNYYIPYTLNNATYYTAASKFNNLNFVLTAGYRF